MGFVKIKSEIVPVTRRIRDYLFSDMEECNSALLYDNALMTYYNVASRDGKSDIWVYQNLVLDGFGRYVDGDSDMYQEALLAYSDVIKIVNSDKKDSLDFFEEVCILEGDIYKEMLREEQFRRIRKKDKDD